MRSNFHRLAVAVALCGLACAPAWAADPSPYQALIDNSPFLTPAFKARVGQRDTSALNFIGYTRVGDEWSFGIVDRKTKAGYWLKLNEEQGKMKVVRFDEKAETIHVMIRGFAVELPLAKGK